MLTHPPPICFSTAYRFPMQLEENHKSSHNTTHDTQKPNKHKKISRVKSPSIMPPLCYLYSSPRDIGSVVTFTPPYLPFSARMFIRSTNIDAGRVSRRLNIVCSRLVNGVITPELVRSIMLLLLRRGQLYQKGLPGPLIYK